MSCRRFLMSEIASCVTSMPIQSRPFFSAASIVVAIKGDSKCPCIVLTTCSEGPLNQGLDGAF